MPRSWPVGRRLDTRLGSLGRQGPARSKESQAPDQYRGDLPAGGRFARRVAHVVEPRPCRAESRAGPKRTYRSLKAAGLSESRAGPAPMVGVLEEGPSV